MRFVAIVLVCVWAVAPDAVIAQSSDRPSIPVESKPKLNLQNCGSYYPAPELAVKASGTTSIGFEVTSNGGVANAVVSHSSGYADLDSAALSCLTNANMKWDFENQRVITGGFVAKGFASVTWTDDKDSPLFVGCPYPIVPLRLQERGKVNVSFEILKDGTASKPTVVQSSGVEELDNAALSCVSSYRYIPIARDDVPVDTAWHLAINFGISE